MDTLMCKKFQKRVESAMRVWDRLKNGGTQQPKGDVAILVRLIKQAAELAEHKAA